MILPKNLQFIGTALYYMQHLKWLPIVAQSTRPLNLSIFAAREYDAEQDPAYITYS